MSLSLSDLNEKWREKLEAEFSAPYFLKLRSFLEEEYNSYVIYPDKSLIFNAFNYFSPKDTKVVILGQDPYHQKGQAHGLAFSVPSQTRLPPSLKNIYKEIERDLNLKMNTRGDLTPWARQGVLLLNSVLSVREGAAGSHSGRGWEQFTDSCIRSLAEEPEPKVFMLWGNNARKKKSLIRNQNHLVLESAHPSPLSAWQGFHGSCMFSSANKFLEKSGRSGIKWQI